MFWHYVLVFLCSFLVDVIAFPLPPAFTVMIFLQSIYHLQIWIVILVGIVGSVLGRSVLTWYIARLSPRIFLASKNEDTQFLGSRLKEKGWRSRGLILVYSLMPLPTTPLFIAAGMARLNPGFILPPFVIGKVISDTTAVLLGNYALKKTTNIAEGITSWQSIAGFTLGLLLVMAILFIDWRTLFQKSRLRLDFKIWKIGGQRWKKNALKKSME